jgi:hypothetical protein
MGQQDLKSLLCEKGYTVVSQLIPREYIEAINLRLHDLVPNRGHGVDNRYWPQDQIQQCPELALWWSQQIADWQEVDEISRLLLEQVGFLFEEACVYVADIITSTPKNQYIKPHIDSPYRFEQWHESFELLGVQCILPLCEFTEVNGGTGLYPGSHLRNWTVKDSYRGVYNEEFLANVRQPKMQPGDALIYHPRVLHSTMPNHSHKDRRALLVHITSKKMAELMRTNDNIFTGKSSK